MGQKMAKTRSYSSAKPIYLSTIKKFKTDTKIRLIYFPEFRARTEAILLMCAYRNVAVEQLPPDMLFDVAWPASRKYTPFSQLPVLVFDDGTGLAQSYAIQKFLARKFKLTPTDEFEESFADETAQAAEEFGKLNPICNDATGDDFKAQVKDFFEGNEDDGPNGNTKIANLSKSLGDRMYFPGLVLTMVAWPMSLLCSNTLFCMILIFPLTISTQHLIALSAADEPSFADFTVLHYFHHILLIDAKKFDRYPNLKVCFVFTFPAVFCPLFYSTPAHLFSPF